ncbi:hypothetical protein COV53_04815 [Candidatus Gottesmanbacteria bacterium CG11_big_fil_rev_8_21_14_0_20_37_11]|uniref:O-antigen ligase-related domain-containing protein n=2 Tax=Candidatus Gottesmaniibacteriota TaxID=1752720 RepID=A0A2H0NGR8_9BACT|nr:MAG: hypothetical protein COV53_04815 [Candidatus Gottesmanbacteria bacterium CG11_big_fil_rev_8_21_14_0_20_37_11]
MTMNRILRILLYASLAIFIFGPVASLHVSPGLNIYVMDILAGLMSLVWLINFSKFEHTSKNAWIFKYFLLFTFVCLIALVLSPIPMTVTEKAISSLYLFRFISYFFVFLSVRHLLDKGMLKKTDTARMLFSLGVLLIAFGWIQYFFYPDLRNLYYLGWDPHFKRIFGSFLDPNYFGLILVLLLIVNFLYFNSSKALKMVTTTLFVVTLAFTYSRSSYLAFLSSLSYYFLTKRKFKQMLIIFSVFFVLTILLPRPGGAGVMLERVFSIRERVGNWQQGISIFQKNPIIGVGFNTLRYAKKEYGLLQDNLEYSHSGAGIDNSYIFVLATTGLTGGVFFILFLKQLFVKSGFIMKISLIAVLVHSLFLNSLFFPWVLYLLTLISAIDLRKKNIILT